MLESALSLTTDQVQTLPVQQAITRIVLTAVLTLVPPTNIAEDIVVGAEIVLTVRAAAIGRVQATLPLLQS